ncbi:hypothetical protein Ancab_038522 [Ancistrocladus abbreviatus]
MDNHSEDFPPGGQPPRKELQGPRPSPLKVRQDSYKIKKPPVGPPRPSQQPQQQPPRPPVIIYTVSPKVIHVKPDDFMSLVQKLTGNDSMSSSSSATSSSCVDVGSTSAISPAARFASIEKTKLPLEGKKDSIHDMDYVEGVEMGSGFVRPGNIPAILSPVPGFLRPISPNFFSPLSDPNALGLYTDLNNPLQAQHGSGSSSFMPSPSASFFSPSMTTFSPASLDFLRDMLG